MEMEMEKEVERWAVESSERAAPRGDFWTR